MRSIRFILPLQFMTLILGTAAFSKDKINYDQKNRYNGVALYFSCEDSCPKRDYAGGYPKLKDAYGNTELCECVPWTKEDKKKQEELAAAPAIWSGKHGSVPEKPKSAAQVQSEQIVLGLVNKCPSVKGHASFTDWYGKVDNSLKFKHSNGGFKHEGCSPLPDGMQCTGVKISDSDKICRIVSKVALIPTGAPGECAPSEMTAPKLVGEGCPDKPASAVEKIEKQSVKHCVPDGKQGRKVTDAWWDVDLSAKGGDSCACPAGYAFKQESASRATCIQSGGKCPIGKILDSDGSCVCPEGFTELKSGQCACGSKVVWSNPPFCPGEESCAARGLAFVGKKCSPASSIDGSSEQKAVSSANSSESGNKPKPATGAIQQAK